MTTRKLLLTLVLSIYSITVFSQLTNKSQFKNFYKEIKFDYVAKDNPNSEYPRLKVEGDETVVDIVQLQGIKLSYIIDYDKWEESTLTETDRDEDWYIDLILTNTTKHDIYYDNPDDVIAILKVPGERTYYDNLRGQEIKVSGGKLVFYAWMLEDKENGKYILRGDDEYEWDYVVNRDAESYFETWVQRRFRPLEASVSIPVGKKRDLGSKNNLIAYKETVANSEIQNTTYGNFSTSVVRLPKKRVFLSTAYPILESKYTFKKNGNYTVIFEDASVRIELKELDKFGNMEYRVTNLNSQPLKMNNNVPIGEITISGSHREEIYLMKKNNFAMQKLGPNETYTKQFQAQLNPVSGEYWVNNHKLEFRKNYPKNYFATNLKLRKIMGATHATSSGGSGNTKIYILYPLNSLSKYDPGMFYFKDGQKHAMKKGQIYRVELSQTGTTKWITFDTDFNGFTYPQKKIDKWLGDKPGLMQDRVITINAQPGESYYYVMVGDSYVKLQGVTKKDWDSYIKNSNMTYPDAPVVIKK